MLLGGFLPVDYDDLCLAEIEPPRRFLERSRMLSMSIWQHERIVEPLSERNLLDDRHAHVRAARADARGFPASRGCRSASSRCSSATVIVASWRRMDPPLRDRFPPMADETTPELLDALIRVPAPSGYEAPAAAVWREAAPRSSAMPRPTCSAPRTVSVGVEEGKPSVAVVGHIDEIGLFVSHIDDEGFLWFGPIGGWDPAEPRRPAGRSSVATTARCPA